jgi:hypothetical protein
MKRYSISELEKEAANLSSFDGNPPVFTAGGDDDLLHFEGDIQNFAGEKNPNKQFSFTVTNAATVTRTAVLWPGYLKGNATLAPGQLADGTFNDTAGNAGLSGATEGFKTIAELFAFLDKVPTRVWAIGLRTTVEGQVAKAITVTAKSPFSDDTSYQVRPKDFQDGQTFQTKILQFATPKLQLDYETVVTYPFVAGSATTLTLYLGAGLNIARGLRIKAEKAGAQMAAFGGQEAVRRGSLQSRGTRMIG